MPDRKSSPAKVLEFRRKAKPAHPHGDDPTTNSGCVRPCGHVLEQHAAAVYRAFASGRRLRVLAAQYGVSVAEIEEIVREQMLRRAA